VEPPSHIPPEARARDTHDWLYTLFCELPVQFQNGDADVHEYLRAARAFATYVHSLRVLWATCGPPADSRVSQLSDATLSHSILRGSLYAMGLVGGSGESSGGSGGAFAEAAQLNARVLELTVSSVFGRLERLLKFLQSWHECGEPAPSPAHVLELARRLLAAAFVVCWCHAETRATAIHCHNSALDAASRKIASEWNTDVAGQPPPFALPAAYTTQRSYSMYGHPITELCVQYAYPTRFDMMANMRGYDHHEDDDHDHGQQPGHFEPAGQLLMRFDPQWADEYFLDNVDGDDGNDDDDSTRVAWPKLPTASRASAFLAELAATIMQWHTTGMTASDFRTAQTYRNVVDLVKRV
jgi:hypothetical protein